MRLRSKFIFMRLSWSLVMPVLLLTLSGCATSSLFTPYPLQIAEVKQDLHAGNAEKALKKLNKRNDADKTLYMLERGRVAQLFDMYDESIKDFKIAIAQENKIDERAKISASRTAAQGASLMTNDNAIPYEAAGFERVLMYQFQALNYLAEKDVEAAGVEVRRANLEQNLALERHDKELANAEKEAREKGYTANGNEARMRQQFAKMYEATRDVKNSFQNAYTFYVSGIVYELLGEPNDAYIDYKKALEIYPDNTYLQKDLLRLSKKLGFREDYELFSTRFGDKVSETSPDEGEVIILFEDGFVPPKGEVRITLATSSGFHTVAMPVYHDVTPSREHLLLSSEGEGLGQSEVITDIHVLAMKDLEERMPAMIIRQVLRILTKAQLQKRAEENLGGLAGAVTMIASVISESADRRNWLTLPRNAQILRISLPAGEQKLDLRLKQAGIRDTVNVKVKPNRPAIVRVASTGRRLYVSQF